MNCQDISRIADTGLFSSLTQAERRAAEAHALSCRHCAPVWAAHAQLADLRIPPVPAELAVRCRTLAALPSRTSGRPALRRLALVGSMVAIAAAAGMLSVSLLGSRTSGSADSAVAIPEVTDPAPAPAVAEGAEVVTEVIAADPVPAQSPQTDPSDSLPLLPPPTPEYFAALLGASDQLLRKMVDRHPELVEGPEIDGVFVVNITVEEDGTVVDSTVRVTTPDPDNIAQLAQELPTSWDGGRETLTSWRKANRLPDGRLLRADVPLLAITTVPNTYDRARSSARVREIVMSRHADLMLAVGDGEDGEVNRLTIFLSDDGTIQREHVERMNLQSMAQSSVEKSLMPIMLGDGIADTSAVADFANEIATRLSLDVGQIGLMGFMPVEEGTRVMVIDASGNSRLEDKRRGLLVKGEFIQAGRMRPRTGVPIAQLIGELAPGVKIGTTMSRTLTDETGAAASVQFGWALPVTEAPK